MCAYKLCKVEFRYWGMQSKIERFIHDVGLRKVMVRAHRQAWCWQDEWYGLTIEDIRQLELETQLALAKKMAQYSLNEEGAPRPTAPPSARTRRPEPRLWDRTQRLKPQEEVVVVEEEEERGSSETHWRHGENSPNSGPRPPGRPTGRPREGLSPPPKYVNEFTQRRLTFIHNNNNNNNNNNNTADDQEAVGS
ncbi:hypothetical protein INR49_010096 [Caranx melampygus]|nr:hypothetical protein INR49_010096 [Caranx melampygus]